MSIKTRALDLAIAVLRGTIQIAGKRAPLIGARLVEQLTPIVEQQAGVGILKFFCPGVLPEWRARTMLTKEPETIEWINGFNKADVLWDIGANIGVYSLYAASRGVTVHSYEPAPGNYYLLSKNIEMNGFDVLISSYCIAFNDKTRLDSFHMVETELGGASNSFGEAIDNSTGKSYTANFKQSTLGFSIDDFIHQFKPLFPNHMKIDVDGIEKKIVNGAVQTLSDKRLKSVLIELNVELSECAEIIGTMETHGLVLDKREHAHMFDTGEFSSLYNHIFVRKT